MRLHTAGCARGFQKPILGTVTTTPLPASERAGKILVVPQIGSEAKHLRGYTAVIAQQELGSQPLFTPLIHSVRDVDHLKTGHIVVLEAGNGFVRTLYRPESGHNTIFVTERCNSNCLMCSQPPIDRDDIAALAERNLRLVDLIDPPPEYLCITGGEPTLLGQHLFDLLAKLKDRMPDTYLHMLTNGRRFAWAEFTSQFAASCPSNFSVGVPLYADYAGLHDYVVQAQGAFDQTVIGLHELARHGIEIEIRVVLHSLTVPRLAELAEYIHRNLTFVHHVAFMGMEHIGYAPRNMEELWIDPVDYQEQLEQSIRILARAGLESRIYNLQLCLLKSSLWKYSKQSISDWKNAYSDVCGECSVRDICGGFFQWATKVQSRGIHPISQLESAPLRQCATSPVH
jgi:His-Xaa-Ser system radical SAM maturase HxsC